MDKSIFEQAKQIVHGAKHLVFLGGAGCSTDSGIPDFRSSDGLYRLKSEYGLPYETMLSIDYFYAHPQTFYSFYWKLMAHPDAKPNRAHLALAHYGETHDLTTITQNIDGLDKASGQKNVLEIHGTMSFFVCPSCHHKIGAKKVTPGSVPHCPHCGAILKPDIVFYGEPLSGETLDLAIIALEVADVLIIGGTSMKVYPAAGLPSYFHGSTIIMINKEPTPFDPHCDFVFHEDIGEALEYLLEE